METIGCTIEDGLARVTLAQGERGNPVNGRFCEEMFALCAELSCRPDVRAVLLSAQGRYFSVGGDIRAFVEDREKLPRQIKVWTGQFHSALARLQRMDAPVVCAVHGDVAGGAVSLAAMSDVVFAAQGIKFNAAFTMIGYCADSGSTVSLSNRMGLARAKRFLLLSEVLDADEAQAAGLVDFVVPKENVLAEAEKLALRLAHGPTRAYGEIKRTILTARTEPFETQLEHEAQALARIATTQDAWEGLTAFSERRKPVFRGE